MSMDLLEQEIASIHAKLPTQDQAVDSPSPPSGQGPRIMYGMMPFYVTDGPQGPVCIPLGGPQGSPWNSMMGGGSPPMMPAQFAPPQQMPPWMPPAGGAGFVPPHVMPPQAMPPQAMPPQAMQQQFMPPPSSVPGSMPARPASSGCAMDKDAYKRYFNERLAGLQRMVESAAGKATPDKPSSPSNIETRFDDEPKSPYQTVADSNSDIDAGDPGDAPLPSLFHELCDEFSPDGELWNEFDLEDEGEDELLEGMLC